jgi:hypothetical protein
MFISADDDTVLEMRFGQYITTAAPQVAAYAAQAAQSVIDAQAVLSTSLLKANNLSDLASASTARTNLGLGTAAVQNVGVFAQTANNLSDVASPSAALANLGGAPLASPVFTGVPTVPTAAISTYTDQAASTKFVLNQASSFAPLMDGSAATGTSASFARADHVHPSDTSRAPLASPTFTGTVTTAALTATGAITPSQTAGIVGTTTNNNAAAGSVGEILTNTTSTTSLTTNVTTNSTSVSLTAGDWDVSCVSQFTINAGATVTNMGTGVSTASSTFGSFSQNQVIGGVSAASGVGSMTLASPVVRISLAGTTTVFAVASASFSGGTCTVNGFIRARRVR